MPDFATRLGGTRRNGAANTSEPIIAAVPSTPIAPAARNALVRLACSAKCAEAQSGNDRREMERRCVEADAESGAAG